MDAAGRGRHRGVSGSDLSLPAPGHGRSGRAGPVLLQAGERRDVRLRGRHDRLAPLAVAAHAFRSGRARRFRRPAGCALHGHQCRRGHVSGLRHRVRLRRRRRLSDRQRGRADHAPLRPLGHVQGADRHDARRHGIDPGRDPRRACCWASSKPRASGIWARNTGISPPTSCCSCSWCSGPAASWASSPSSANRRRRGGYERWKAPISSRSSPTSA